MSARPHRLALLAFVPLSAACSGAPSPEPFQPTALDLPRAGDVNTDEHVVEVNLEAKEGTASFVGGTTTPVWGYGGGLPGPTIEANVGDRVIVHLKNSLPEETSIHWHGIRVPSDQDGMEPVAPGTSRTYEFVVPDAGLYWYHPHFHTDQQVEKGLYGLFVVRGTDTVDVPERLLAFDDVLVDDRGQPLPTGGHNQEMLGREGNVMLVNGKVAPTIEVRAGSWERWRIVSAANARYFDLRLPDAEIVQIGTDGGWLPAAQAKSVVRLTPGERVDLLVHFTGNPGSTSHFGSTAYTRGHGIETPAVDLLSVRYSDETAVSPTSPVPATLPSIEPLPANGTVRTLRLQEQMDMASGSMKTVFQINGETFPNVTPVDVKLGDTEVWEVVNESEMDHPFHVHGFSFQPLTVDGKPQPLAWKDTINVPAKQTVRFAIRYADHAGMFPFHCHILEHAELGMVGLLEVSP